MKTKLPARIARFIAKSGENRLRLMAEISRRISSSTDPDEVLTFIVEVSRDLIKCDAAGIFLLNQEKDSFSCVAGQGYGDTSLLDKSFAIHEGIVGWVLSTGESVIVDEAEEDSRYLNLREQTRSQVTVPIITGAEIIGAFDLESDRPGSFTEEDMELLSALATQAAIAHERAALHQERMQRKRLDEELRIAREVQLSLLPGKAPCVPNLEFAGINVPSRDVGGDYYDFISIAEGQLGIAIADVSGKGIPAALIMASFRAFLRAEIRNNYAITTIFSKVNNLLSEIVKDNQFVSAFYGVLNLKTLRFTYSNAGHHPPILFRGQQETERQYLEGGGLLLGLFTDAHYDEQFIDLRSGDFLLLYTDGLVEAENEDGEMFGHERLEKFVEEHLSLSARELCDSLYVRMAQFTGVGHSEDDTTVVAIKIL